VGKSVSNREPRLPGPDHPIAIERNHRHIVVTVAGHIIADTKSALTLMEAKYPPILYIPRRDVDMSLLQITDHTSYCPYKGDCTYYGIPSGGEKSANAAWSYEKPYASVSSIDHHLAFYPDRVDSIQEMESRS
jgi:uncharacterized protein (DUF427 family)